ncbi:MAG: nitronate monooxygenase family protein [bacterium]|nr:nitronate monooxygenase family protein [bacterium]
MGRIELSPLNIGVHTARVPVVQGGMSVRISGARLASAVAREGGVGTIGGVGRGFGLEEYRHIPDFFEADRKALGDEIKRAKELEPKGIIGVNLLVAVADYDHLVRTAVESGADFIVSGAGLPMNLPALTVDHPNIALIPIVSSVKAFSLICRKWERDYGRLPDAVVIEAPSTAGGHLGVTRNQGIYDEALKLDFVIPETKKFLEDSGYKIPIIGAGGQWDRPDIDHLLELGADGVQMATRFVCTVECDAPDEFKQKYLDARPEDIVEVVSPVGIPGRAIRTEFSDFVNSGAISDDVCLVSCLKVCSFRDKGEKYCIIRALSDVSNGNVEDGIVFAGSNAYRSNKQGIVTVKQIFKELTATD